MTSIKNIGLRISFITLILAVTFSSAFAECIRFGGNTYEVCWSGDKVTSGVGRGKHNDAKVYGGYYSHPYVVVVFAKPQEKGCNNSQTYFMKLVGSDKVKLMRWTNKCGETQKDGTVYERNR